MAEVRELTLHRGRFEKSTLYKVKKGWRVVLRLGPEFLAVDNIRLMTNYPGDGETFDRNKYRDIYQVCDMPAARIISGYPYVLSTCLEERRILRDSECGGIVPLLRGLGC